MWGEQEMGPKKGRGKTEQPESANQCYSSAIGGHWQGREQEDVPLHLALHSPLTFTDEAMKEANMLPMPWST